MSKFDIKGDMKSASVSRDSKSISFTPGETERLCNLVSIARRMRRLNALPEAIFDRPFKVSFFEDDTLALSRAESKDEIAFEWGDTNDLVESIKKAMSITLNAKAIGQDRSKTFVDLTNVKI
jgi:hypothetical protein